MISSLYESKWLISGISDPDQSKASALLLTDGTGNLFLLDRTIRAAFPIETDSIDQAGPWFSPKSTLLTKELLDGVSIYRSASDFYGATAPTGASTLGTPTATIRDWDPSEALVLPPGEVVFHPDQTSDVESLVGRLRERKQALIFVAYIHSAPESPALNRWLRRPSKRRRIWPFGLKNEWIFTQKDSVHFLLAPGLSPRDLRNSEAGLLGRLERADRCAIEVKEYGTRSTRYFERSGFADIVFHSGHHNLEQLPADLWITRCNAAIAPAREPMSTALISALWTKSGSTAFLADPISTRLWQTFLPLVQSERLIECLQGLVAHFTSAKPRKRTGEDVAAAEVRRFLESFVATRPPEAAYTEVRNALAGDAVLAPLGVKMPDRL